MRIIKRLSAVLLAVSVCFSRLFFAFYADEAVNLTSSCKITPSDPNSIGYLLFDGNTRTGLNVKDGTVISFKAPEPVSSLYLVWDTPHPEWDFVFKRDGADVRLTYGEYGFLHEYADLNGDFDSITLEFYGSGAILCDVYAFSGGDVPDWVQIWQPPLEKADLLVLPARAGDEFLYFGGAIPYYAEKGKSVQAAYMTNLYNEPLKTHALLNALYASGLRVYPVISGFPEVTASSVDVALEHYDENEFLAFATGLFRRFKPEVVIGQGEYGDGVQMLSASAVMIAAELSGDALEYRESAKEYGAWDVPKVYLHGYGENGVTIEWGDSLNAARHAFSEYSWRQNRSIATEGVYDCRKFGLFRTITGIDVNKDDLFENIGLLVPDVPEAEPGPTKEPEAAPAPQGPPAGAQMQPGFEAGLQAFLTSGAAIPSAAVLMITAAIILRRKKD